MARFLAVTPIRKPLLAWLYRFASYRTLSAQPQRVVIPTIPERRIVGAPQAHRDLCRAGVRPGTGGLVTERDGWRYRADGA